jgi:hypothetical protein
MPEPFTPIPNHIIDAMSQMKGSVLQVVLAVARKTVGYSNGNGGRKEWDMISLSQFSEMTGLSRPAINVALHEAVTNGWIERRERGQSFEYGLVKKVNQLEKLTSKESLPVEPETSKESLPELGKKVNTQKKGNKELMKDDLAPTPSDRDGRWLLQKLEEKGFIYKDTKWRELSIKLESDYDDTQLLQALTTTAEAHQKKINSGERGITAPLAYMQMVLTAKPLATPQPTTPVRQSKPYRGMQVLS